MRRSLFVAVVLLFALLHVVLCAAGSRSGPLPLKASWAGARQLPPPFGIGVTFYHHRQDYNLLTLYVPVPGLDLVAAQGADINNRVTEFNVKFDAWLLPFVNLFGLVGKVDGKTEVTLEPAVETLDIDYDGVVYGGGFTLAAGAEPYFGSLTFTCTSTDLDATDSSAKSWVLSPRAGVRTRCSAMDCAVTLWGGAMYQSVEEKHAGTMPLFGPQPIPFQVELEEKDAWNILAGAGLDFHDHWYGELEGGFLGRKHLILTGTYRF